MLRALLALLAATWLASPGCTMPGAPSGAPPTSVDPTPFEPVGEAEPLSLPLPCGALAIELSSFELDVGGNLSVVATFRNCGDAPILLAPHGCMAPAQTPEVLGPAYGFLAQGTLGVRGASCGPIRLDVEPDLVPAGGAREVRGWWNGSIPTGCATADGGWRIPCGKAPAPSGVYVLTSSAATVDGNHSWTTSVAVTLRAWNESRGAWTEHHPVWRAGPAEVFWRGAVLKIPPGQLVATDGEAFLYRTERVWNPLWAPPPCEPSDPGNATWVLVSPEPCQWARHPGTAGP